MTRIEIVAAVFGVISVYLSTRQNIWSWPTAIVNVGLYIVFFFQTRFYADMGLQAVYLVLSIYGWYEWLYGGENHSVLRVSRAPARLLALLAVMDDAAWVVLASLLHRYTNAALPWLDSFMSTTSLIAQWLMTRKILENWAVWILLDIIYVPMWLSRGYYATAALYAVFLVLAVLGYRDWARSFRMQEKLVPA